jgi:hypothetical protein
LSCEDLVNVNWKQCWNLRNFEFKSQISDPIQSFYFCYYIINLLLLLLKLGMLLLLNSVLIVN